MTSPTYLHPPPLRLHVLAPACAPERVYCVPVNEAFITKQEPRRGECAHQTESRAHVRATRQPHTAVVSAALWTRAPSRAPSAALSSLSSLSVCLPHCAGAIGVCTFSCAHTPLVCVPHCAGAIRVCTRAAPYKKQAARARRAATQKAVCPCGLHEPT